MKKKAPKLRAWGKPTRKVMTMVIPTKKDKARKRANIKSSVKKSIEEETL